MSGNISVPGILYQGFLMSELFEVSSVIRPVTGVIYLDFLMSELFEVSGIVSSVTDVFTCFFLMSEFFEVSGIMSVTGVTCLGFLMSELFEVMGICSVTILIDRPRLPNVKTVLGTWEQCVCYTYTYLGPLLSKLFEMSGKVQTLSFLMSELLAVLGMSGQYHAVYLGFLMSELF